MAASWWTRSHREAKKTEKRPPFPTATGLRPQRRVKKTIDERRCWMFSGPASELSHRPRARRRKLGFPNIVVQGMMSTCFVSQVMQDALRHGLGGEGGKMSVKLTNVLWVDETVTATARSARRRRGRPHPRPLRRLGREGRRHPHPAGVRERDEVAPGVSRGGRRSATGAPDLARMVAGSLLRIHSEAALRTTWSARTFPASNFPAAFSMWSSSASASGAGLPRGRKGRMRATTKLRR